MRIYIYIHTHIYVYICTHIYLFRSPKRIGQKPLKIVTNIISRKWGSCWTIYGGDSDGNEASWVNISMVSMKELHKHSIYSNIKFKRANLKIENKVKRINLT